MEKSKIKQAAGDTWNSFKRSIPNLITILLLIAFLINAIPHDLYSKIFTGNSILDSLTGGILGSISAGNPINSYVLGGEFLDQGVSKVAIVAFLLTWSTVGIVQLPAESLMLGKRFAIIRNTLSFFSAIIIAILVNLTLSLS